MKKDYVNRLVQLFTVFVICFFVVSVGLALKRVNGEQKANNPGDNEALPTSEVQMPTIETTIASTEVAVGFGDSKDKPMSGQRIAYKCAAFVPKGEKLTVEVYVGDYSYEYGQRLNIEPSYDTYGVHGYPNLRVYQLVNEFDYTCKKYDDRLLINGKLNEYQKVYAKEEMASLELLDGEDVSEGKCEHVEFDFSRYEVGSAGNIRLSFSWDLGEEPEQAEAVDLIWLGNRVPLAFYVGENGVSIAGTMEDAEKNYNTYYLRDFGVSDDDNMQCTLKECCLFCENELEREYTHGELIEKRYELICMNEVDKCEVLISEYDGVEIVEVSPVTHVDGKNSLGIKFRVKDDVTLGNIRFSVIPTYFDPDIKARELTQTIYVCNVNRKDYVSLNYIDGLADYSEAISKYINETNNRGEHVEHTRNDGNGLSNTLSTTHAISGYIKWTDSVGNTHPAEGATVQIYKGTPSSPSYSLIYTSTTTSTGYYGAYFSYEGSVALLKIRVLSSGTNINVVDSSGATYTYESMVSGASSDIVISYTANNLTYLGKALSVHQGLALANRYMKTLENSFLSPINVRFYLTSGTSYYSSSQGLINILIGDAFDWDVLEHEFGHYVQNVYGITNSPGGSHSAYNNLADTRDDKSAGVRLAWGEGWATYFSINLQNKMGTGSLNIPFVGDTYYQDTEDQTIRFDIENLQTTQRKGEANEATVAAVLYDITDAVNTSEADQIYVNNSTVWNITKYNGCKSLSDFIAAFDSSSSIVKSTKVKLGSTLSRYLVSAKVYAPSVTGNTVTYTWDKQGGSTSFPNNSFRLVFFDASFNILYTTSYVNATSQSISRTQWNNIFGTSSVIYCCVQARQTASPITGPYYSNIIATYSAK